tara:strand:- start:657 stop:1304 length:648 start_codon:yes stop_codon:yes gene_type:complete
MADPWKTITVEGVRAFTKGVLAATLIWISFEGHLVIVTNFIESIIISSLATLIVFYSVVLFISYLIIRKGEEGFDENEKRATMYSIITIFIIWFFTAGYLNFIPEVLIMVGVFEKLSYSLLLGTILFTLLITIFYGLDGRIFTTMMLGHMPWVKNPDKYLFFFWAWINLIALGILNVFELNAFWVFVNLFFYLLIPSLYIGTKIQQVHGQKKDSN